MRPLARWLRKVWHDVFYGVFGDRADDLGLHCRDVVESIDLPSRGQQIRRRLQFYLHLSVCQLCANYFYVSRALGRAARRWMRQAPNPDQLHALNAKLLKKFASRGDPK